MANHSDEVTQRLDRIIVLLQLAFRDQIDNARSVVMADPVAAAVLDATEEDWVAAGTLKRQVASATKQSERTVARRLSQLVAQGWLQVAGAGASVRYRSTGLT